jgi:hypothetical protein
LSLSPELKLQPLPYHRSLAHYLRTEEPETWAWFASAEAKAEHAESLRLELLKQTYRLDAAAYPDVFAALADAKSRLGLEIRVTLYQSQRNVQLNASIVYLPGEAHIIFEGGILQLLNPAELRSVLGHELAHYLLWDADGNEALVTDRAIHAMANDPRAEPSHQESARLMRLYTEIFADRGSLQVTGDPHVVISSLVKLQTGLTQVDVPSYVRQADEIFSRSKINAEHLTHPEAFIRARAINLWAENASNVDAEVARMIEGETSLDRLDLLAQQRVTSQTRRWLQLFLKATWLRTDAIRGQLKLYFPEFDFIAEDGRDDPLLDELRRAGTGVRDYFCYVLLDFVAADPELELEPLREAFALASEVGWDERLETLAVKELKLKKRDAQRVRAEARERLSNSAEIDSEPANEAEATDE